MTAVGELVDGRYRAEHLLGIGGMAAVWLGRDLLLDRPVAIKMLSAAGLTEPMAAERFEREARSVAQLTHPNVVAVHDFGSDEGKPYLIMEMVDGVTVAAMLKEGPLTVTYAAAIAAQTCDGLAAAHSAGVVHRDIKPSNLIVTPAGVVKICDFGIARMLGAATQASLTGETDAVGSVSYMAPERVRDKPIDHRVDLYGLGCTLYAMLTGAPPFVAENAMATLHLHLTRPPTPVTQLRADVPPTIEALLDDLLAKTPESRPADAMKVKARLLAALPDGEVGASILPVTAVPLAPALSGLRPPAGPADVLDTPAGTQTLRIDRTSRHWNRRSRGIAAAATVGLLIVAALLFGLSRMSSRAPSGRAAAVVETPAPTSASLPSAQITESVVPPSASPSTLAATAAGEGPPTPIEPIAAVRVSIQRQVDTGNLAPDAASDLYRKADEIARETNEGDLDDAAKKIDEFRHKLDDLLNGGKLTTTGYADLTARIDAVEAAVS